MADFKDDRIVSVKFLVLFCELIEECNNKANFSELKYSQNLCI